MRLATVGDKKVDFAKLEEAVKKHFIDTNFDELGFAETVTKFKEYKSTKEFKEKFVEEPKVEEKPIKIGGIEYKLEDLQKETKEYYADVLDFDTISEEKKAELVTQYINTKHFKEARASIDRKHQEVAKIKKELETRIEEYEGKDKDLDNKIRLVETKLKEKEKEFEELKGKKVSEDLIEDDEIQKELVKIEIDKKTAEQDKEKLQNLYKSLANEYNENLYALWSDSLQLEHPELATNENFEEVILKVERKGKASGVDETEFMRADVVRDVLFDYKDHVERNPESEITIVDFFDYNKSKYPNYEKVAQTTRSIEETEEEKIESRDLSELTHKQQLELILKRQIETPPSPKPKTEVSTEKLKGSEEKDDLTLEMAGYSTKEK